MQEQRRYENKETGDPSARPPPSLRVASTSNLPASYARSVCQGLPSPSSVVAPERPRLWPSLGRASLALASGSEQALRRESLLPLSAAQPWPSLFFFCRRVVSYLYFRTPAVRGPITGHKFYTVPSAGESQQVPSDAPRALWRVEAAATRRCVASGVDRKLDLSNQRKKPFIIRASTCFLLP